MNMEDFQEKMDPNHRALFCRMLKMKELPECLLELYLQVKMMVDRIDGFLSAGSLALIAIMAGFNPEAGKFCVTEMPVEQTAKEAAEKKATPVEAPTMTGDEAVEQVASGAAVPVGETEEQINARLQALADKGAVKTSVDESDVKPVDESDVKPVDESDVKPVPAGSCKLWSPGMPVNVLREDELRQGKIVGVLRPELGSEKAVRLTVEFDGGETLTETVTVDEDEVEAV